MFSNRRECYVNVSFSLFFFPFRGKQKNKTKEKKKEIIPVKIVTLSG
jgi:hypothetical protein